jgi:hypothetical protein
MNGNSVSKFHVMYQESWRRISTEYYWFPYVPRNWGHVDICVPRASCGPRSASLSASLMTDRVCELQRERLNELLNEALLPSVPQERRSAVLNLRSVVLPLMTLMLIGCNPSTGDCAATRCHSGTV